MLLAASEAPGGAGDALADLPLATLGDDIEDC